MSVIKSTAGSVCIKTKTQKPTRWCTMVTCSSIQSAAVADNRPCTQLQCVQRRQTDRRAATEEAM